MSKSIKHIQYGRSENDSPWRKISIGSWKPRGDSSTYAFEEIIVDAAEEWCHRNDVSLNSFILKAVASATAEERKINSIVRFGKIYQRKNIRLFYHVLPSLDRDDLSGALIDEPQDKAVHTIESELKNQFKLIRKGEDDFAKSKRLFKIFPGFLARPSLNFMSFIAYSLNLHPFFIPTERDPFGSMMVTNIGSLGLSQGCTPIAPYTRIPMVMSIGKSQKKVCIENGDIIQKSYITFGFTFDHRIMDGVHFSKWFNIFSSHFKNPERFDSL